MSAPEPAFTALAPYFEALYATRSTRDEVELPEQLALAVARRPLRRLLDLGCGTGRLTRLWAARGYEAVGLDRAPHMLEQAMAQGGGVRYRCADITSFRLNERFDIATCWFSTIEYLPGERALMAFLRRTAQHLDPGGCLVLDFRNADAVLRHGVHPRFEETSDGARRLLRFVSPRLDRKRRRLVTQHRVLVLEGERLVQDIVEDHVTRLVSPAQLRILLHRAGFVDVRMRPLGLARGRVGPADWTAVAAARIPVRSA